jgi:hypothetical protein
MPLNHFLVVNKLKRSFPERKKNLLAPSGKQTRILNKKSSDAYTVTVVPTDPGSFEDRIS